MVVALNILNVFRFASVMVTNFTSNQSVSVQWVGVPVSSLNSCYAPPNFPIFVFLLIFVATFILSLALEIISHVPFFCSFIPVLTSLLVRILSFI